VRVGGAGGELVVIPAELVRVVQRELGLALAAAENAPLEPGGRYGVFRM
jgi:hypothetical protein